MTNQELNQYVKQLSLVKFDRPFNHGAAFNNRLRTTGGRFFPKNGNIEFNPKMSAHADFEGIVLHELTHYHLYFSGQGYRHKDSAFKVLLAQVGGLRYAPEVELRDRRFAYICKNCKASYYRMRRVNVEKYRCGKCRGQLILLENSSSK